MIGVVLSRLAVRIVCTSSESERLKKKKGKKTTQSSIHTCPPMPATTHTHTHTRTHNKKRGKKLLTFLFFLFFLYGVRHTVEVLATQKLRLILFFPLFFFSSSCFFLFFSLCVLMLVSARCTNDVASTFTNCVSLFKKPVRCSTSSRGRNMKLHCL